MAAKSHIRLNRDVKIDGVDFEAGTYPAEEIDGGRHSSIMNAGWGEYCDAPKSKAKVRTEDDDDLDDTGTTAPVKPTPKPTAPKPAGKKSKTKQTPAALAD